MLVIKVNLLKYLGIEKNYLVKNKLTVYNFSERDKYFINDEARHEIAEKDGQWKPVANFFVDTKYNADCHKKISFILWSIWGFVMPI